MYVRLLRACSHPGEFSPCFTELQKMFVKRYPAKLKNLLRLVKYWYKEVGAAQLSQFSIDIHPASSHLHLCLLPSS